MHDARITDLLLIAGADLNAAPPEGDTALTFASQGKNPAAVKVSLNDGTPPKVKKKGHGGTSLMWAAAENAPRFINLLIQQGADSKAQATYLNVNCNVHRF